MKAFYDYTVAAGVDTMVTQFTSSDFNRTFIGNGNAGVDHAWGGHQIVLGGAVQGRDDVRHVPGPHRQGSGRLGQQRRLDPDDVASIRSAARSRNGSACRRWTSRRCSRTSRTSRPPTWDSWVDEKADRHAAAACDHDGPALKDSGAASPRGAGAGPPPFLLRPPVGSLAPRPAPAPLCVRLASSPTRSATPRGARRARSAPWQPPRGRWQRRAWEAASIRPSGRRVRRPRSCRLKRSMPERRIPVRRGGRAR